MGSPREEHGRRPSEGPRHTISLTRSFYLGQTPVTQEQFQRVMGYNPARFSAADKGNATHPVEQVSWSEASAFCRRLSALPAEKLAGRTYRLPTEAEWEYACRAGSMTPFAFGFSLGPRQAVFQHGLSANEPTRTAPVQGHPANAFGLYDMHGNVWEWCADWFDADAYRLSATGDPRRLVPQWGVFVPLRVPARAGPDLTVAGRRFSNRPRIAKITSQVSFAVSTWERAPGSAFRALAQPKQGTG